MIKSKKSLNKFILAFAFTFLFITNSTIAKAFTHYEIGNTITGYTGSNLTAHGYYPQIGDVAVHCTDPIRYKGDTRALYPIIPFGTRITVISGQSIPTPIGNLTQFWVEDTGDTDHKKFNAKLLTWKWLDVYVGKDTPENRTFAANNLGGITRDYMWEDPSN
jgi:hypothetical protein